MIIRYATPEDYIYIMAMYEAGLRDIGEYMVEEVALAHVVNQMKKVPCVLLCDGDIICGMIGLQLIRNSHNCDARLSEYMVYLYPRYRNLKNLSLLVDEVKELASAVKMPLTFFQATDAPILVKARLARMNGFTVKGLVCEYE